MPKQLDANKHSAISDVTTAKLNRHNESRYKQRHFEKIFRNFSQYHKNELKSVKNQTKRLSDELIKFQKISAEKSDVAKSLINHIELYKQDINNLNEQKNKLVAENNTTKKTFQELENKYATLENTYDSNLLEMRRNIKKLEESCKDYQALKDKLAEQSKELLNMKEINFEAQKQIEISKNELKNIQTDFENYKVQTDDNKEMNRRQYEAKIKELEQDLNAKELLVLNCQKEKDDLEETKNKIIEEQSFKMREIERVFGQPTNRVVPQSRTRAVNPEPVTPLQEAEPVTAANNIDVPSTLPENNAFLNRNINYAFPSLSSTQMRQTGFRGANENTNSSDEDYEDFGWRPIQSNYTTDATKRGSTTRKRPALDETYVPESSESDYFEELKRSKK